MHTHVKGLERLQEIDLRIDGRCQERARFLTEIAELEGKVEAVRLLVAEKSGELASAEEEKRQLDDNMAAEDGNIVRAEARQREIKTQKEYQAVAKEISTARKLKTELEDQALQTLSRIDELKAEIGSRQEELSSLEQDVNRQKVEAQSRISSLDQEIAADTANRESTQQGIPVQLLKRYAMLREKRQGLAVVEAKDGSCLGCNMNLPPQVYNSLFKNAEFICCPHCQRVLFVRLEGPTG